MKNEREPEYQGISLRHVHVENSRLPRIKIFYKAGTVENAEQVSYGIEEEGLPYEIILSKEPMEQALTDIIGAGLGVSLGIDKSNTSIFCRLLKEKRAFMTYCTADNQSLRNAGKNAARAVKRKPFVFKEDKK